jgi:hypothetical protein
MSATGLIGGKRIRSNFIEQASLTEFSGNIHRDAPRRRANGPHAGLA